MLEFSIPNLIDVNIASSGGVVVFLINGEPVNAIDFTAVMAAVQVLVAVSPEDEDDDEEQPNGAPHGGTPFA